MSDPVIRKAQAVLRSARRLSGEEKSWANGGYSGTVDENLRAMTPEQREQVYKEHPWLRPKD